MREKQILANPALRRPSLLQPWIVVSPTNSSLTPPVWPAIKIESFWSVGVVAQLVEHHNGIVGVRGSNPLGSTISVEFLASSLVNLNLPNPRIRLRVL